MDPAYIFVLKPSRSQRVSREARAMRSTWPRSRTSLTNGGSTFPSGERLHPVLPHPHLRRAPMIFVRLVDHWGNLEAFYKKRSSSRLLIGIPRRYNALLLTAISHLVRGYLRSAGYPADASRRCLYKRKHGESPFKGKRAVSNTSREQEEDCKIRRPFGAAAHPLAI